MLPILRTHALQNIWCEPIQDSQYWIGLARLTPVGGALKTANVLWESIRLPNYGDYFDKVPFHVFQIGQIATSVFKFEIPFDTWVRASDLMTDNNLVTDVFFDNGCQIPKTHLYFRKNKDKNLILAIKGIAVDCGQEEYIDPVTNLPAIRNVQLGVHPVYLRFYANARYRSSTWLNTPNVLDKGIRVVERYITKQEDFFLFRGDCDTIRALFTFGTGLYYQDGFVINEPLTWSPDRLNKTFSFYYDESAKETSFHLINALPVFASALDVGHDKYLVLRATDYGMIDYFDDIDIYLVDKSTSSFRGVLVPLMAGNRVRMVTHNTLAVQRQHVLAVRDRHLFLKNSTNLSLMLLVREGGMRRGLIQQHVRIEELYRLNYAQRLTALVTQTDVPEWNCAALEQNAYTRLMRLDIDAITQSDIDRAYGYNAATKIAANPLQQLTTAGAITYSSVPPVILTIDRVTNHLLKTVYVYNATGQLLSWFNDHSDLPEAVLPTGLVGAAFTEVFNYTTSATRDGCYYETNVASHDLAQYGFRAYACPIVLGVPSEQWYDVTDTAYYTYDPDAPIPTITWNTFLEDMANLHTCIKVDKTMHVFTAPALTPNYPGYIRFTVESTVDWLGDGNDVIKPQRLEPAAVDVFMDGNPLIEDLDYYVQWPVITVVKRPSTAPADTVILVRSYGLALPTTPLTHNKPRETGFVKGGILSVNKHYDIRNDRPTRIIVADRLRTKEQVKFAEHVPGLLTTDGRPYALYDYPISCTNFTLQNTIPFRHASVLLDDKVSNYLTDKIPEDTVRYPQIINAKWDVFSPFCSALIHALLGGFLNAGELDVPYTNAQLHIWVTPWLYLLDTDPCVLENVVDDCYCDNKKYHDYVIIYPHPYLEYMTVTGSQYRFLELIISLYLNNRTDLTPSVKIGI